MDLKIGEQLYIKKYLQDLVVRIVQTFFNFFFNLVSRKAVFGNFHENSADPLGINSRTWYNELSSYKIYLKTIQCVLRSKNFHSCKKIKKLLLTKVHIKNCLRFAYKYRNWTKQDWHKIYLS